MEKRRTIRQRDSRESFRTIDADMDPLFLASFPGRYRSVWKCAKIETSLAANGVVISGHFNWRRKVRDFWEIPSESWPTRRRDGRPAFRPIIADKDPLLPASPPARYRGDLKRPEIEDSLTAFTTREARSFNWRMAADDSRGSRRCRVQSRNAKTSIFPHRERC